MRVKWLLEFSLIRKPTIVAWPWPSRFLCFTKPKQSLPSVAHLQFLFSNFIICSGLDIYCRWILFIRVSDWWPRLLTSPLLLLLPGWQHNADELKITICSVRLEISDKRKDKEDLICSFSPVSCDGGRQIMQEVKEQKPWRRPQPVGFPFMWETNLWNM